MNIKGLLKSYMETYCYRHFLQYAHNVKRVLMDLPYNRVDSTPTRHHMLVNKNPST